MQKEVLIHVRGLQMMDAQGDQEPIEIIVPGQYYFRNGSHYLRYEELLDETAEPTINYIKVSGKGLEVSKKGLVNVHMVFEQGKKNMTYYTTPYGTLQMGISATNLELTESEENLQIKADYDPGTAKRLQGFCFIDPAENKRYIITLHKNSRHVSGEFLKAWRLFWILIIYGILRGSLFSSSVVLRENHGFLLRQRCKDR